MSYHRPTRPSASAAHDSNMYEDLPYEDDQLQYEYHDASPQGYRKGKRQCGFGAWAESVLIFHRLR